MGDGLFKMQHFDLEPLKNSHKINRNIDSADSEATHVTKASSHMHRISVDERNMSKVLFNCGLHDSSWTLPEIVKMMTLVRSELEKTVSHMIGRSVSWLACYSFQVGPDNVSFHRKHCRHPLAEFPLEDIESMGAPLPARVCCLWQCMMHSNCLWWCMMHCFHVGNLAWWRLPYFKFHLGLTSWVYPPEKEKLVSSGMLCSL